MTASDEHAANSRKGLIVSDPAVMMGKPVIAGTRITVELILETLAQGGTIEYLLDGYPRISEEDIRAAALQFVRKVSGYRQPSRANAPAFDRAVEDVTRATDRLLAAIEPSRSSLG